MTAERLSRRALLARMGAGLLALAALPAAAVSVFGLTDDGRHYVVDTGAGLAFGVRKSDGAMSWATYRGQASPNHTAVPAFAADGALVTARRTGDHIVVRACATDASGATTYRYLVARKADPAIYLVVHADDNQPTDGPRALLVAQSAAPKPADLDFLCGLGLLGLTPHGKCAGQFAPAALT